MSKSAKTEGPLMPDREVLLSDEVVFENGRCPVCRTPVSESDFFCPICGFRLINPGIDDDPQKINKMKEEVLQYRKSVLRSFGSSGRNTGENRRNDDGASRVGPDPQKQRRNAEGSRTGGAGSAGYSQQAVPLTQKKQSGMFAAFLCLVIVIAAAAGIYVLVNKTGSVPAVSRDETAIAWEEVYDGMTSESNLQSPIDYENGSLDEIKSALLSEEWSIEKAYESRFTATRRIDSILAGTAEGTYILNDDDRLEIEVSVSDDGNEVEFRDYGYMHCGDYPQDRRQDLISAWHDAAPYIVTYYMYSSIEDIMSVCRPGLPDGVIPGVSTEDMLDFANAEASGKDAFKWKGKDYKYTISYHEAAQDSWLMMNHHGSTCPVAFTLTEESYVIDNPGVSEFEFYFEK